MNIIYGTIEDDILNGTDSDDEIYGLAGSDIVNGGIGNDRLVDDDPLFAYHLTPIEARGSVEIIQQPYAANDYTLILEFDDNPEGGSAWYEVQVGFPTLSVDYLTVRALIDGRSQLVVNGNDVFWHHFDFAAPGRHEGANEPTLINSETWFPEWPDFPTQENRVESYSSVFDDLSPALPQIDIFGNDVLYGGAGNDIISTAGGHDIAYGGEGDDSIRASNLSYDYERDPQGRPAVVTFYGGAGDDSLSGSGISDDEFSHWYDIQANLYGEDGNDRLSGGGHLTDYLDGGSGDDILVINDFFRYVGEFGGNNQPGADNDILRGGAGADVFYVDQAYWWYNQSYTFTIPDYNPAEDKIVFDFNNDDEGFDVIPEVFNVDIDKISNGHFFVTVDTGGESVNIHINKDIHSGDLFIKPHYYSDESIPVLFGDEGNDGIQGGNGSEFIIGNAGDDELDGNAGGDIIYGGIGHDRLEGGDGDDVLDGGPLDTDGNDILRGEGGNDTLYGKGGDDDARGGSGDDQVHGGLGNDKLYGDSGNDGLYGDFGDAKLSGGDGHDVLDGSAGTDKLYGGNGDDTLDGGLDADSLYGDAGNDTLKGSYGADVLYGGGGADAFNFDHGRDTVKDFNLAEGDTLVLFHILEGYDPLVSAISDFVTVQRQADNTVLSVDWDGTGGNWSFVQVALLEGVKNLGSVDELLANGTLAVV